MPFKHCLCLFTDIGKNKLFPYALLRGGVWNPSVSVLAEDRLFVLQKLNWEVATHAWCVLNPFSVTPISIFSQMNVGVKNGKVTICVGFFFFHVSVRLNCLGVLLKQVKMKHAVGKLSYPPLFSLWGFMSLL